MTRLLHLIGTSEIGGTERFVVRLLGRLKRDEFASAICVLGAPGALAAAYEEVAERVIHLDVPRAGLVRAVQAWRRQLAAFRPDVLVLYGSRANLLGRLFRARTPVVTALRSVFVDDRGSRVSTWVDRATFRHVSVCVSNSRAAVDQLRHRGYPPERLVHIPNAIDIDAYRAVDRLSARQALSVHAEMPIVVCVANLRPMKGLDTLVAASATLHEAGVRHNVWVIGEGPERSRLERMSESLGATGRVQFVGAEQDVRTRLAAADIAVLPSRWEGMPTVLLEAMAAGLPVVASRVGEIPHVIEDGVFGRLVTPGDAGELASALAELLTDASRRRTWGQRAAAAVERYSLTRMIEQYEAIFRWAARGGGVAELEAMVPDDEQHA